MEYSGLLQKYKVDRPLTEEERKFQLKQRERLDVQPHYQLSVIKMNSTFLESVDKYYGWKGVLTFVTVASLLIATGIMALGFVALFADNPATGAPADSGSVFAGLAILTMAVAFASFLIWLLLKESFAYTHYPIRLNRKNRTVYVFRFDGTVLSVPWDEVFFTLGRGNRAFGLQNWDIRGHVLDTDGVTVRETFAFAVESDALEDLRRHWEFLRRYMEDGPSRIIDLVEFCMPVAESRESFKVGFERLVLTLHGQAWAQIILFPFFVVSALGRWFAMRTSEIPIWPKAVEEACPMEPDDPYVKDSHINPLDLR